MNLTYYNVLAPSYLVSIAVWLFLSRKFPDTFLVKDVRIIKWPRLQICALLLCSIAVIFIGRAYTNDYLVSDFTIGSLQIGESINQVLIYSPFPLFLILSKQSLSSGWLPTSKIAERFAAGMCLSLVSLIIFVVLSSKKPISNVIYNVFHIQNTHHLVQVFLEDFSIALLLSRLSSALKPKYFVAAIITVSILFTSGHLPNNLETGVPILDILTGLTMDAILVLVVGIALYKSRDFLWFFPIHFAMDMMQFYSGLKL